MRIVAGSRKGARIFAPKGETRPTGDRVREAAFNLIGPVDEMAVLDLFAGSGAMGLEALSRGAATAVFVESDREAQRTIERNLEKLELRGARIVKSDARRALAAEAAAGSRYDLVLVDPPYRMFDSLQPILATYVPALLAEDGLVVVETDKRTEPELPLSRADEPHLRVGAAHTVRMSNDLRTAICPGSYDPVTLGHLDIIRRAAVIFDRIVVGVVREPSHKETMFSVEERVAFLEEALRDQDNVEVDVFSELVVEFAKRWGARTMVKGLRVISDFEWEFQMNHLNRTLAPDVETVYLMSNPQYSFVSSSGVKEVASFGGNVDELVPEPVARRFKEMFPAGKPGAPVSPQE